MDLKCIRCGKVAQFVVKGDSLCQKDLPDDIKAKLEKKEVTKKTGLITV